MAQIDAHQHCWNPAGDDLDWMPMDYATLPRHEVAVLAERPLDGLAAAAGRVLLNLFRRTKVFGDEAAQMVGIASRIRDDMVRPRKLFDQVAGLRTFAPLAWRDFKAHRQPRRVDRGVNLRGQTAA